MAKARMICGVPGSVAVEKGLGEAEALRHQRSVREFLQRIDREAAGRSAASVFQGKRIT